MGYLIDTCIWVDVERGTLAPGDVAAVTGEDPVYLSPVTIAELEYGVWRANSDDTRRRRRVALDRLRKKPTLIIDGDTGRVFGEVAAHLTRSGRGAEFRVQDVWLASQAIQHGHRLLTENEKDFKDIPGLDLVILAVKNRPPAP
jgi:predicted nucleic acid-binding protein